MTAYMEALGVNFGCLDFIVPKVGGESIFLEINPNGQWLWVQQRSGQDIGKAIANRLLSGLAGRVRSESMERIPRA